MSYRIAKQFYFSAAHRLLGLPIDHQCGRYHGHNYVAEIVLESDELAGLGFAGFDYGELKPVDLWIKANWEHQTLLNVDDPLFRKMKEQGTQVYGFHGNPSAERMASVLYEVVKARLYLDGGPARLIKVRISETPKTWAEYRP